MEIKRITKDMTIGEIIKKYPGIDRVFDTALEPGCKGCPEADNETIEFSANMLGLDIERIVKVLNDYLEKQGYTLID